MEEKRINWKTILVFSLAGTMKSFAFIVFFPMLFLKEKRITHIILDTIGSIIGCVVCLLPFLLRGSRETMLVLESRSIMAFFNSSILGGLANISIFLSIYIIVCVIAYLCEFGDNKQYIQQLTWLIAVSFWALFSFVLCHPYWIILFAPFITLVIAGNENCFRVNTLLETIGTLAMSVAQLIIFPWCYFSRETFSNPILGSAKWEKSLTGLLDNIFEISQIGKITVMESPKMLFYSVFVICLLCLLAINIPGHTLTDNCSFPAKAAKHGINCDKYQRGLLIFRVLCIIGIYVLGMFRLLYL